MFTMNDKEWEVVFVPTHSTCLLRSNGTETVGVTDNVTRCVYLNENLRGGFLERVLCHELVHVACFSYGCTFSIEQEETIADFLATFGREIFRVADSLLCIITFVA